MALLPAAVAAAVLFSGAACRAEWDGGMVSSGADSPGRRWYFAEGCTRPGFEEWLTILNPGGEEAHANVACFYGSGERSEVALGLPAGSRVTLYVNDVVPGPQDVAVEVSASADVVAERTIYFRYQGRYTGGHLVTGAKAPADEWYFAEGTTRTGFDTWLCVMNPTGEEAAVEIEYMLEDGRPQSRSGITVAPGSRFTVAVFEEGPGIGRRDDASGDVSIRVRCTNGPRIVCERPMYFRYRGLTGGHDVMGAPAPLPEWYFAEGCARSGFDTWLCVQNPGGTRALIDIDYLCGDGATFTRRGVEVAPRGRRTIDVCEPGAGVGRSEGPRGDVSIRVRSTNGVPVVCERPMYFRYKDSITGGHDAVGAPAPADEWYFAEGTTRTGFDTWLCVQNPSEEDAAVCVDYICADTSWNRREEVAVPARSRVTVPVFAVDRGIGRHDDARGDVALKVTARGGVPVVCERSVYFSYRNRCPDWRTIDRAALAAAYGFNEVRHGNRNKPRVAVTFDAGSGAGDCARLLDTLRGFGVRSTFFVTGRFALTYPDLVRRIAAEGHEVCNHSYSHPPFDGLSPAQVREQLEMTETVVSSLTGVTTRPYFRFPYGRRQPAQVSQLGSEGYMSIYWAVAGEWYESDPAEVISSRVMRNVGPGDIVLLHVDTPCQPEVISTIVPALRARGLEPVTVTEVLLPDAW